MKKYKDISTYIQDQPKSVQPILKRIRATIQKAAPKAEEYIGYGMPGFKLHGPLVYFAAWKKHIAFYALPSGTAAFKKETAKYKTSKGTIQFPLGEPIPFGLITKIVKFRVKENVAKSKTTR